MDESCHIKSQRQSLEVWTSRSSSLEKSKFWVFGRNTLTTANYYWSLDICCCMANVKAVSKWDNRVRGQANIIIVMRIGILLGSSIFHEQKDKIVWNVSLERQFISFLINTESQKLNTADKIYIELMQCWSNSQHQSILSSCFLFFSGQVEDSLCPCAGEKWGIKESTTTTVPSLK